MQFTHCHGQATLDCTKWSAKFGNLRLRKVLEIYELESCTLFGRKSRYCAVQPVALYVISHLDLIIRALGCNGLLFDAKMARGVSFASECFVSHAHE